MTSDGEGPLYDVPSTPTDPCEDGPEDDEKEEEEENNMEIDASDLKNHPKANCVYSKLNNSGTFKGVISKFAGENTNFDLKIEMADLRPGENGSLNSSSSSDTFAMQINSGEMDRTAIEIARTFLHEGIHVELSRKVASVGGLDSISVDNFPGIYDFYRRHYKNWSHEQMAAYYKDKIVDGLKEFDNAKHSDQFYNDLAWRGLESTTSWDQEVSSSDNRRIKATYKDLLSEPNSKQCN